MSYKMYNKGYRSQPDMFQNNVSVDIQIGRLFVTET